MRRIRDYKVKEDHPDYITCKRVADKVTKLAGGDKTLRATIPNLIRRAIDEVIDTPRTGRLFLDDIEKTEKTYIGTKIEILVRDFLGLPKGKLDLEIDGEDVDIKNTIGDTWTIPIEAIDQPCLLVGSDEKTSLCYLGVIVAHTSNLTNAQNRDGKRSVSSLGFENIYWLLCDYPYPENFWNSVSPSDAAYITDGTSGASRIRRLFRRVQGLPIGRDIVSGMGRQLDPLKRIRKNGGARDKLMEEGIALLSGKYDRAVIAELRLPECDNDQFISMKPNTTHDFKILEQYKFTIRPNDSKPDTD